MLATVAAAVVLVGVLFAAMAVGVMLGRRPIKGSCGGVGGSAGCPNCACQATPGDAAADDDAARPAASHLTQRQP